MARPPAKRATAPKPRPAPAPDQKAKKGRKRKRAKLRADLKLFQFREKQKERVVYASSIICAISTKAGVVLYTVEEGEVKTYTDIGRTLASMEPMDEIGFLRIHGSVVLNMAYYRGMSPTREVTLAYPIDHTIYVSVRHLPAVKRFLDRYCY
jgi:DNA-binding LytR/AlgR family response regulator